MVAEGELNLKMMQDDIMRDGGGVGSQPPARAVGLQRFGWRRRLRGPDALGGAPQPAPTKPRPDMCDTDLEARGPSSSGF